MMAAIISQSAFVAPEVYIGEDVTVAEGSIVRAGAVLGDGTFIGPHCIIGEPTKDYYDGPQSYQPLPVNVGKGSIIRAGTIIYAGATVGEGFQTGPYVVIRERTTFGRHCSLGNNCDVQADVSVGDFTRCHSNVTLGQHSVVGNYCWLMPYVLLMNDLYPPIYLEPHPVIIGDFSVLGARVIAINARLGKHVVAAAGSAIMSNVEDFSLVRGNPAERIGDCRHLMGENKAGQRYYPYPWPEHRSAGYPFTPELIAALHLSTSKGEA